MKIKVYPVEGLGSGFFTDKPGDDLGMDPYHPFTYPGDEVQLVEEISADEAIERGKDYFRGDHILYTSFQGLGAQPAQVRIWERTGRDSREIIENR